MQQYTNPCEYVQEPCLYTGLFYWMQFAETRYFCHLIDCYD
jgi:hypothetical protein